MYQKGVLDIDEAAKISDETLIALINRRYVKMAEIPVNLYNHEYLIIALTNNPLNAN